MRKIAIGIVLFFMITFIACEKEEAENITLSPHTNVVTTSPTNLPLLPGLYFGRYNVHYTSPSGGSNSGTDSVYAIVDTVGANAYQFIVCEDSLLTGTIYDTISIDLQNQVLKPCDQGQEYYSQALPGGFMHNVILVLTTCDSAYINREYRPISSHSGSGVSFNGKKLN